MSSSFPSIPSINTKAEPLAPKVLIPRIQNCERLRPGSPEVCMVMTPATRPPSMLLSDIPGAFSSLGSIVEIAPTTDTFFCELKPVTTTSSTVLASSLSTNFWSARSLVTNFSMVFIPTACITRVAFGSTLMVNFPSKSETTPRPGTFLMMMVAPGYGSSCSSTTTPDTVNVLLLALSLAFCAKPFVTMASNRASI